MKKEGMKEAEQLLDERDVKWKVAYEARYKRIETFNFVNSVLFDSDAEAYTSKEFECAAFKEFLLFINLDVTGTPTDIRIDVEFSPDRNTWFKLMNGPFGSLIYEDGAGDKKEALSGRVVAHWFRIYVISSGCSAGNTFNLSVDCEFSG